MKISVVVCKVFLTVVGKQILLNSNLGNTGRKITPFLEKLCNTVGSARAFGADTTWVKFMTLEKPM